MGRRSTATMLTFACGRRCPKSSRCACCAPVGNRKTSRCDRDGEDFVATAGASAGDRYTYVFPDGTSVPDPVLAISAGQRSRTDRDRRSVALRLERFDSGAAVDLRDYVIYELHIGTFTPEGTFDSATRKLEYLKQLGITVVEIMPVAACPGHSQLGLRRRLAVRVQANYGGPDGLKRFVDAAHRAWSRGDARRGLQPSRSGGQLPAEVRPVLHCAPQDAVGRRHQLRQRGLRARPPATSSRTRCTGFASTTSTDCGWTQCRPSMTIRAKHILAEIQERVQELARELDRTVCVIAETDENDSRYVKAAARWRLRAGRRLERRLSPCRSCLLHRRATGLLPGFRRSAADCPRPARWLRVSGPEFWLLESPARDQREGRSAARQCNLHSESRPDWQPRQGRTPDHADSARSAQAGGRVPAAGSAYSAAVHGAGVRRDCAISVLRRLPGSRAEEGGQRRPAQRVQGFRFRRCARPGRSWRPFERSKLTWADGAGKPARCWSGIRVFCNYANNTSPTASGRQTPSTRTVCCRWKCRPTIRIWWWRQAWSPALLYRESKRLA